MDYGYHQQKRQAPQGNAMPMPSLDNDWEDGARVKPRIQVLEVRDRERPEGDPIAWLVVERQTTFRHAEDQSVFDASITISYQVLWAQGHPHQPVRGSFAGCYCKQFGVSLTSASGTGAVFLDPPELRGHRLGTYFMNEVVSWVKRWPDAEVRSVRLLPHQADEENRERRNWFYEQFRLVFDFDDHTRAAGRSRSMLVRDLKTVDSWKQNIFEHSLIDHLIKMRDNQEHMGYELAGRERAIRSLQKTFDRATDKPIAWAVEQLWARYRMTLVGAVGTGCCLLLGLD